MAADKPSRGLPIFLNPVTTRESFELRLRREWKDASIRKRFRDDWEKFRARRQADLDELVAERVRREWDNDPATREEFDNCIDTFKEFIIAEHLGLFGSPAVDSAIALLNKFAGFKQVQTFAAQIQGKKAARVSKSPQTLTVILKDLYIGPDMKIEDLLTAMEEHPLVEQVDRLAKRVQYRDGERTKSVAFATLKNRLSKLRQEPSL